MLNGAAGDVTLEDKLEMGAPICEDSIPIAGLVVDMNTKLPNDMVLVKPSGISRLSRKRNER
jgi:hypothetical protein